MAKSGPKEGGGLEREAGWGGLLAGLERAGWAGYPAAACRTARHSAAPHFLPGVRDGAAWTVSGVLLAGLIGSLFIACRNFGAIARGTA
ncbi:hypothetical protein LBMAG56_39370 [Verrucomicrobiota bacterium]|nr:hypothetical protein LBMAG56_39370 [Verrucomicrobiota bacterium]